MESEYGEGHLYEKAELDQKSIVFGGGGLFVFTANPVEKGPRLDLDPLSLITEVSRLNRIFDFVLD